MPDDATTDRAAGSSAGNRFVRAVHRYGDQALLVHAQRSVEIPALLGSVDGLAEHGHPVVEAHAGERAILVRFRADSPMEAVDELVAALRQLDGGVTDQNTETVVLPVRYDGPDLTDVATTLGMTKDGIIDLHSSAHYEVAFCGFSPGFAYLRGLPDALHIARRDSPRTRVPAGSLAIAAHYCAVYPSQSPGGWQLIGNCETPLFNVNAEEPFLLRPGTAVRFEPTR